MYINDNILIGWYANYTNSVYFLSVPMYSIMCIVLSNVTCGLFIHLFLQ